MAKIRFGVIGCGGRGTGMMHAFMHDPRTDVIAVCDTDKIALESAAAGVKTKYQHEAKQFTQYQDLLALKDIDAVLIAPPDNFHHEIGIAALKAQKHVFLEKPVGISLDQMWDIVKAGKEARDKGKIMEIGYVLRYAPFYSEMKRLLDCGEIGRPLFASALEQYHGAPFMRGWWKLRKNTGGIMIQKICHDMDIHYWMFGVPKKIVAFESLMEFKPGNVPSKAKRCPECTEHCYYFTKSKGTNSDDYECVYNDPHDIVDTSQVMVQFQSGLNLSMGMNFVDSVAQSDRFWRIVGSKAEITGNLGSGVLRFDPRFDRTGTQSKFLKCIGPGATGHAGGESHQTKAFLDGIEEGHEAKAGLESAYWSSILVMGAQLSSDTETIVKVTIW